MNKREQCVLTIKEGKYVTVRKFRGELKLCIEESQDNEVVIIRQRYPEKGGGVEMAFEFPHSAKHCSPKVEENSLKLEWSDNNSDLPECHWFKRINDGNGEIYCLKSVVSPERYIGLESVVSTKRNKSTLGLCQTQSQSVRVTHSRVN